MTEELWIAVWAGVVGFLTSLAGAAIPYSVEGYRQWNLGPRDAPFDMPPMAGRLKRAFKNFMETYVLFAVIVISLNFAAKSDAVSIWGARLYLLARIVYVPLYAFGVHGVRSLAFGASILGLVMCLFTLLT